MELSDASKREFVRRLLLSRMRILVKNGFYGLLLMHTAFAIDEGVRTACTDGKKIYFGPNFLKELSDAELDIVMMHEILHIALRHCFRTGKRDNEMFNIACDIVVNSNIMLAEGMGASAITLRKYGELMHIAPNGEEGCKYTAEEVYEMLASKGNAGNDKKEGGDKNGSSADGNAGSRRSDAYNANGGSWDDHSRWGTFNGDNLLKDEWEKHLRDAVEAISVQRENGGRGTVPLAALRLIKELGRSKLDWRTLLAEFVQEDVNDYSFTPPDKRYDGDFFLPDFNSGGECVKNVLFMADASGSVSDDNLTATFSEIKGAIDQFDGRLQGYLGFFDAAVYAPAPFESVDELLSIKPRGGGGTDFYCIFEYIFKNMPYDLPDSIIILTDGFAPFPPEQIARGIPVLWVLNNELVNPPWGKVARIKKENENNNEE